MRDSDLQANDFDSRRFIFVRAAKGLPFVGRRAVVRVAKGLPFVG